MDNFVYVLTTEWNYCNGDDLEHKIIGVFDSFKKAFNEYQKKLQKYDEANSNVSFKKSTDNLEHTIYDCTDNMYMGYYIEKIKIQ